MICFLISSQLQDATPHHTTTMTTTMKAKTIARLYSFFDGLDQDLEIGLACALADKLGTTPAVIFSVYEAWQVAR